LCRLRRDNKGIIVMNILKTETTTLDMVPPGQHCRIVKAELRGPVRRRFMDMGLVTGATIEVVRMAPLGDPMELKIKGYLLSVRKEDAQFITVEWTQNI
jgi:ferrous iron transport protein A